MVGISRSNFTQKFHCMSGAASTYHDAACGYLRHKWGPLRNASKLLARFTGSSPRTTRKWLDGENPPGADAMITLMARDPGFKRMILELEAERAFDERAAAFQKEISEIGRLIDGCL